MCCETFLVFYQTFYAPINNRGFLRHFMNLFKFNMISIKTEAV